MTATETRDRDGRLWRVAEPIGTTATYAYDIGGRLHQVDVLSNGVTQRRLFNYDNRGFLVSESHPEKSGLVTYGGFDALGNPGTKNDGSFRLSFGYDASSRLTTIRQPNRGNRLLKQLIYATSNNGNDKSNGRLRQAIRHNWVIPPGASSEVDGEVKEIYSYRGPGGRVSSRRTGLLGQAFEQSWTYSDLGDRSSVTYPKCQLSACASQAPGSRTVSFTYDSGFLRSIPGYTSGQIGYHSNGMVASVPSANGLTWYQDRDPSGLPRPAKIRLSNGADLGANQYDGAGNITDIGPEVYLYDKVSRVVRSQKGSGDYQNYAFDGFGNLKQINHNGQIRTILVDRSTNRMSAASYDGAGNLTLWNDHRYTWDALGQLMSIDRPQRGYLYTAEGHRIYSLDYDGTWRETWTLRDLSGKPLREYYTPTGSGGPWSIKKDYVWRDGTLLASDGSSGRRYYYPDHLGSPRIIYDAAGGFVESHHYFAFGEEGAAPPTDETVRFTGHQRDFNDPGSADDLDYMLARFYSPHLGRFLSTDPARASADPVNPQSWNRYSYVRNNPMKSIDPDGRFTVGAFKLGLVAVLMFERGQTPDVDFQGPSIGVKGLEWLSIGISDALDNKNKLTLTAQHGGLGASATVRFDDFLLWDVEHFSILGGPAEKVLIGDAPDNFSVGVGYLVGGAGFKFDANNLSDLIVFLSSDIDELFAQAIFEKLNKSGDLPEGLAMVYGEVIWVAPK